MYLIEQAREIPSSFVRNWQSFKLTKFAVWWCGVNFLPPASKQKEISIEQNLTLIDDLLVALVPDDPGLWPGVPRPAGDLPLRPGVDGDPRVRVDQLQLGGRNWKKRSVWGLTLKLEWLHLRLGLMCSLMWGLNGRVIVVVQLHEHYGINNNNNFACICIIPDLINIYVWTELVSGTQFAEHQDEDTYPAHWDRPGLSRPRVGYHDRETLDTRTHWIDRTWCPPHRDGTRLQSKKLCSDPPNWHIVDKKIKLQELKILLRVHHYCE